MQILHVRNMSSEILKEFTLMLSSLYRFKDGEELEQTRRILINWDTVTQESTVARYNNISVISRQSVLLVKETRVPGENQVTDKLLSYNVISSTPSHERDSSSQR
jgi:hypothetical protein